MNMNSDEKDHNFVHIHQKLTSTLMMISSGELGKGVQYMALTNNRLGSPGLCVMTSILTTVSFLGDNGRGIESSERESSTS